MHIFALFLAGITLFYLFSLFPSTVIIIFLLSSIFLLFRKRYFFIPIIIIGFLYAFLRHTPDPDISYFSNREVIIACIVEDPPHETSSGRFSNEAKIVLVSDANTGENFDALKNREINIVSGDGLKQNLRYMIFAKTGRDLGKHNPGTAKEEKPYAYLQEVIKAEAVERNPIGRWFQESRNRLNRYLKDSFESDSGALLAAVTTGERSVMSDNLRDSFSATGLAHLLSISGTHFGLFSTLIFLIFRFIIMSLPYRHLQRLTIYLTPSQASAIISLPFMLFYLIISGASIPALRSFIMINIFLLGLLIGRKGYWLNTVLFAAFLICIWESSAILNLSFQLSFLAVLFIGISVGDREVNEEKQGFFVRIVTFVKNALILSLSASLGTAPLVAYYFHYFSVISPVSNLIITPYIGFILVPLSLVSAFIFIFSGYYPFQPAVAFISGIAIKGVNAFATIPSADIKIPAFPFIVIIVFYAGLALYLVNIRREGIKKKWYAAIFPLVAMVIFFISSLSKERGLAVTYLDVGQGDSSVIEASGKVIAIDTGRTGRELSAYLRYLGRREINALVLTHADGDHSGGVRYLIKKFTVREIWDNGLMVYPDVFKDTTVRHIERGDVIKGDGIAVFVLHPYKGFYTFDDDEASAENNDSIVLKVAGKKASFLFAADTAEEAEEDMLHLGAWLKSNVIKIAHHGSRTSSIEDFISAVSPEIAVISVGRHNPYGHPHRDTLEKLQGIKIYRTDRDGAIKITETSSDYGGGLAVKTYKEFQFERARNIAGEWRNLKRLFEKW